MRHTPESITHLEPNEIFVFGSNRQGLHLAGAARIAVERFGAIVGEGRGPQGNSYAIVTMDTTLESIALEVDLFLEWAREWPSRTFLVTKIGCGIAGWKVSEIGDIFRSREIPPNVILPKEFH